MRLWVGTILPKLTFSARLVAPPAANTRSWRTMALHIKTYRMDAHSSALRLGVKGPCNLGCRGSGQGEQASDRTKDMPTAHVSTGTAQVWAAELQPHKAFHHASTANARRTRAAPSTGPATGAAALDRRQHHDNQGVPQFAASMHVWSYTSHAHPAHSCRRRPQPRCPPPLPRRTMFATMLPQFRAAGVHVGHRNALNR